MRITNGSCVLPLRTIAGFLAYVGTLSVQINPAGSALPYGKTAYPDLVAGPVNHHIKLSSIGYIGRDMLVAFPDRLQVDLGRPVLRLVIRDQLTVDFDFQKCFQAGYARMVA